MHEEDIARLREELSEGLREDVQNRERVRLALARLEGQTGLGPHAAVLLALTGLTCDEPEASAHWEGIRERWRSLEGKLGRPVALRVALVDYFIDRNAAELAPNPIEIRLHPPLRRDGIDPLTGLLDGEALSSHLQREVQRARRFRTGFSLLLIEIDAYDEIARDVGDANGVLIQRDVGLLLSNAVRDIDPAARLRDGRMGVVLPETDRTGAFLVADRLQRRIVEHFAARTFAGRKLGITVSAGVASFPEDAGFGAEVFRRAEQALYHARSRGTDRISVHYRDRREYIRVGTAPHEMRIEVVERGRPASGERTGQVPRNISQQGVLLQSSRPFEVGQEISVICDNLVEIEQIILPGRVVRVEALDDDEDGTPRYEVGIAFELNWEHQVMQILEFVDKLRPRDGR